MALESVTLENTNLGPDQPACPAGGDPGLLDAAQRKLAVPQAAQEADKTQRQLGSQAAPESTASTPSVDEPTATTQRATTTVGAKPTANASPSAVKTGVAEWASHSVNLINGCRHECRYCYAAFNACDRYHRIPRSQWPQPVVRDHDVRKRRRKMEGRVMFPTTHDITPEELGPCLTVLGKLLAAGNEVLIVSKPHLECIQAICDQFAGHRSQILFRFTIGADNDDLLRYWEPGAPDFAERLACLRLAHERGFATSVSMEPMLDVAHAPRLVNRLLPYVTETIWLGKMNGISCRVRAETDEDHQRIDAITAEQNDEAIRSLYAELQSIPQVRWKDSIKKVMGIPLEMAAKDSPEHAQEQGPDAGAQA
jgi:hypothetical protein